MVTGSPHPTVTGIYRTTNHAGRHLVPRPILAAFYRLRKNCVGTRDLRRLLKQTIQQGRRELSLHKGVAGMIPTARVERPPLHRGGSASTGIVPATPLHFSAAEARRRPLMRK